VLLGLGVIASLGSDPGTGEAGASPSNVAEVTESPSPKGQETEAPPSVPAESEPPSEPPTAPPPTETSSASFGDGTHQVGTDIQAGTYRLREPASICYWARLSGFGGELEDVIANDNVVDAYAVVTIAEDDAGFESNGCGDWSDDVSAVTSSATAIESDGTYILGTDIDSGDWRSTGGDLCYWARLKDFSGELDGIIANDNVSGPTIVTIDDSDVGFTTRGCGAWTRS
jgi:hypothetical protein